MRISYLPLSEIMARVTAASQVPLAERKPLTSEQLAKMGQRTPLEKGLASIGNSGNSGTE